MKCKLVSIWILVLFAVAFGQIQQQQQFGNENRGGQQNLQTNFNRASVNRQDQIQRQGASLNNGPNVRPNGRPNGPSGFNRGPNQAVSLNQQVQLQGQPSLVNIGGCSRGVSLRNADGSTLVCGFGPHDFACPEGFSCTFDNGLRALVCCPSSKNVTLLVNKDKSEEEDGSNPCPDQEPITDEFGRRLKCDFAGGPTNVCPSGTLCVVGACCPVSVAGLIAVKPGKCPLPLPVHPGQKCENECSFDSHCPAAAKCCFTGCGARCVASVAEVATPVDDVPNGQLANNGATGPLSGQAASLAQFNLQRQGRLGPQVNGQQAPQGFGQQGTQGRGPQGQQGFGQRGPNGPQGINGPNVNQPNAVRPQNPNGPTGPNTQQVNPFFNQQTQQFQFPNSGPPGFNAGPPGQQRTGPTSFQPTNRNRQADQAL